jgi:hypothetical protein
MFFLTQADTERLNIRGSRDPLGLVPLWGSFGRKVVGNLTTASSTVRGFTTLILGFHFAEQVAPSGKDRENVRLTTFLKFEQLAGYARQLRNSDSAIRGITEIKRRLEEEGTRRIRIGAGRDRQILSNQKIYGLWGLYTVPTIASGFLVRGDLTLSPTGRDLVDRCYAPLFRAHGLNNGEPIVDLLKRESAELDAAGKHTKIFDALGKILAPAIARHEHAVYHEHLVLGGGGAAGQGRFAELVEAELPGNQPFDAPSLERIIKAARRRSDDAQLAHQLQRIRDLEKVLVVMGNLFGFLQDRDSAKVSDVVRELGRIWKGGLRHIDPAAIEDMKDDIGVVYDNRPTGDRFAAFSRAVREADFERAIEIVLEHNRFVMDVRHRAQPWVQAANGKLDVRYRDRIATELRNPAELASAWESGFYLDPLKLISDELRRAA